MSGVMTWRSRSSKRQFLLGIGSVLLAGPAMARYYSGDTESGDGADGVEGQGDFAPGRGDIEITQARLLGMSHYEVEKLVQELHGKWSRFKLDGFSDVMSTWIASGLHAHTRRMRGLIRDMSEIKDSKKRKRRLDRALSELDRIIKPLEEEKNPTPGDDWRLRRFRRLRQAVEVWSRYPNEGTN